MRRSLALEWLHLSIPTMSQQQQPCFIPFSMSNSVVDCLLEWKEKKKKNSNNSYCLNKRIFQISDDGCDEAMYMQKAWLLFDPTQKHTLSHIRTHKYTYSWQSMPELKFGKESFNRHYFSLFPSSTTVNLRFFLLFFILQWSPTNSTLQRFLMMHSEHRSIDLILLLLLLFFAVRGL